MFVVSYLGLESIVEFYVQALTRLSPPLRALLIDGMIFISRKESTQKIAVSYSDSATPVFVSLYAFKLYIGKARKQTVISVNS
ncbi:branched-chain amino acid transporter [Aphanothece sacrum FPU1]|uniref:Branched-chain amino acid transporter n=1 Tax=Aphanothece sacrum FPU1 TaxID=1920663 RepID=A0A401IG93_APHSA|nr:branched-chain amino acid transporter [Aphanothece sacrum FPU1]GBF86475.1 branched-chain amino acid transporter [Aphanothece sacrum FPU3]